VLGRMLARTVHSFAFRVRGWAHAEQSCRFPTMLLARVFPDIWGGYLVRESILWKKTCVRKYEFWGFARTHFRTCFGSRRTCSEANFPRGNKVSPGATTERHDSSPKLLRADFALLCTLTAWAARDRRLQWISAPNAVLESASKVSQS
jgi:hypothetical protein